MQINQALKFAIEKKKLSNLDAEVLLCFSIKKDKAFIYSHPEYKLSNAQENKFKKFIARRVKKEPVAYIIGKKEFYGLDFIVNKNVLIPRPESELLVEEGLKLIKKGFYNIHDREMIRTGIKSMIVDIGTGSGCVIVSLAKNIKNKSIKFYATDICKKALNIAQNNVKLHKIDKKIEFIESDLLKNININFKNSILVVNLPYLPNKLKSKKDLKFEPKKALYAGKDGLDLYRKLFLEIKDLKNKPIYILCEFGDKQDKEMKKIIKNILPKYKIKIKKDLASKNRVAIIKF